MMETLHYKVIAVGTVAAVLLTLIVHASAYRGQLLAVQVSATDSRSDYIAHCSNCHGSDGKSQTPKGRKVEAPDLTKSAVSDAKGIRMITNGKSDMPAFRDKLTPEQISALMNYVRGFRR